MASITKRGKAWRADVNLKGVRKSATRDTKAAALAWAAQVEGEIIAGKSGAAANKTFGELLRRYVDEVSSTKRGERWERMRVDLLCRDEVALVRLRDLSQVDLAAWRDRRLRAVSNASVCREMNLVSHALNVAWREWKWLPENPLKGVRRPPPTRPRDRRISEDEIERLLFALGYDYDDPPQTATARVGAALLFAIETGMRCGEIAGLAWEGVYLDRRFCTVAGGKTHAAKRDVPLSAEALRLLVQVKGAEGGKGVFGLTTGQIDALFRKAKGRAMIEDLHFHDARHEAITRLAKKLGVLDLARMVGHRDIRMLQVYYNATAEEMAGRLD